MFNEENSLFPYKRPKIYLKMNLGTTLKHILKHVLRLTQKLSKEFFNLDLRNSEDISYSNTDIVLFVSDTGNKVQL